VVLAPRPLTVNVRRPMSAFRWIDGYELGSHSTTGQL